MERGNLTAKLRDAVIVNFIKEGPEPRRFKTSQSRARSNSTYRNPDRLLSIGGYTICRDGILSGSDDPKIIDMLESHRFEIE